MGVRSSLATLGARSFASYALTRAAAPLPGVAWHRYLLLAVPRSGLPAMPRGYRWEVVALPTLAGHGLPDEAAAFRAEQGMECLGLFRADALVGVNWIKAGGFDEDEVFLRFEPPPAAAWDTGLFILPHARGGRAFAGLWAATGEWLAARGLDWSMSRIADYNHASLGAHLRLGGVRVGSVAVLRMGDMQLATAGRPAVTRLGGVRPVLRVPAP